MESVDTNEIIFHRTQCYYYSLGRVDKTSREEMRAIQYSTLPVPSRIQENDQEESFPAGEGETDQQVPRV